MSGYKGIKYGGTYGDAKEGLVYFLSTELKGGI
jgi:hypothetical protein